MYGNQAFIASIYQDSKYDQKVRNRQNEMAYADELEQRAKQKQQEQMIYDEAVNQYMEKVGDSVNKFMPKDQERIKALEIQSRQAVINHVKASGGDMKRFFLTGGNNILREYRNNILQSKEVSRAVNNKSIYDQIVKDQSEGKMLGDTVITVTDKNGKKIQQQVSSGEMLRLFNDNKIDSLSYGGAYEPLEVDLTDFAKIDNPRDPYNPGYVSVDEMAAYAQMKGGYPQYLAERFAKSFAKFEGKDGKLYTDAMWGSRDNNALNLSRIWEKSASGKIGYKGNQNIANWVDEISQTAMKFENVAEADWDGGRGGKATTVLIGKARVDAVKIEEAYRAVGLQKRTNGSWSGNPIFGINKMVNLENGAMHDIKASDYTLVGLSNVLTFVQSKDGGSSVPAQPYLTAQIKVSEDYSEEKLGENWFILGKQWAGVTEDVDVPFTTEDERIITVGIPLDVSPTNKETLNQRVNLKTGEVIGGMHREPYIGAYELAPEGSAHPSSINDPYGTRTIFGNETNIENPYGSIPGYNGSLSASQIAAIQNSGLPMEAFLAAAGQ